ncbi:FAD-dependent monooxygenase [Lentisphaerota bacterium ZTH]|nr:FAD-dependent monooxygenase [Lentisphaerota bacterium]WET06843.1 FAD-dependent monooxygenase [Lentisphaerota bacterium ZTH]
MLIKLNNLTIRAYLIPAESAGIDLNLKNYIASHLNLAPENILSYDILSKSIDSRRGAPALVYSLAIRLADNEATSHFSKYSFSEKELEAVLNPELKVPAAPDGLKNPIIVGTGPAGLFAALLLARAGCDPVIIDRGYDVDQRAADIEKFHQTRELNPDSNYLIGEGGAGTFSDGKLYTRTRDPRTRNILNIMISAGAPKEIAFLKRPHIGSDILPVMVRNIRQQVEQAGGKFIFGVKVEKLMIKDGKCTGVITSSGEELEAPAVIMAHGLSGRELTDKLVDQGVEFKLKGFQIGCRIEHPQQFIDENQYRMRQRPKWLGPAEYHLSNRPHFNCRVAGVTSFCMCPGGEIVASTAEPGQLATNGMSRYSRAGKFANSCLIVNQSPELFTSASRAYKFLRELEQQAFTLGGGDFTAPAQDARAFVKGKLGLKNSETSYQFGLKAARLDQLLPVRTTEALTAAMRRFDHKFHGFLKFGKLVGIETNVSSPVRFLRNPESLESSVNRLYVAGEGAGFAGGILSAAADGLKVAEKMLESNY